MTARHRTEAETGSDDSDPPSGPPSGAPAQWRSWLPGRSIRTRLLSVVALPMAVLVVLAGAGVVAQLGVLGVAGRTVAGVRLALTTQDLIHELQRERGLTNGLLGGKLDYRDDVIGQRRRVDDAGHVLDDALRASDAALAAGILDARNVLHDLPDVRSTVDVGTADRTKTFDFYTSAIDKLADAAGRAGSADVTDLQLLNALDALRSLGDAKESTALERGFLNGVFAANAFQPRDYVKFAEIRANRTAAFAVFDSHATDTQTRAVDAALNSPAANAARDMEQRAVDGATAPALGVPAEDWWTDMTTLVDDLHGAQQQVGADAEHRADDLRADALRLLVALVALTVLAVAVAVLLVVVIARSITRPLHALATSARHVAQSRLPGAIARVQTGDDDQDGAAADADDAGGPPRSRPIEVRTDEIGDVIRALDQVEHTAIDLARQQAVLRKNAAESFSSLARRNQNLLRRQLGFITDLERREQEPDSLANLFELDHLATRMRRNAESLLVLVGDRSPRRWSHPVPASDILRAALSEVEDYRRVTLRRVDEVLVAGPAGADLAHLLAELIENALSFSPPDREVEIHSQRIGEAYAIAVVDHGIGLPPDELARANARLSGEEAFLIAPTRFLGHYVVGQLARKLNVAVRLHESPLSGVTARVALPAELVSAPPAANDLFTPTHEGRLPWLDPATDDHPPAHLPPEPPFRLDRRPASVATLPSVDVPARIAAPLAVLEPAPYPYPAEPDPAPPQRTRNGLPKRVRTAEISSAPPPPAVEAPEPPAAVRTTRAFLDFRAGYAQNRTDRRYDGPPSAEGTP